jgi:peptidoglycan/LPS O-acetylase OafA/YrhL
VQAWYPAANWIGCYNGVAWSISAEGFFYLMFPLLLLGTTRNFWTKYVCLFAVTFTAMIVMASTFAPASPIKEIANASLDPRKVVQFFPPFRLLEFMTGMAAGMIFLKRKTQSAAFAQPRHWSATTRATALEVLVLALSIGCYKFFVSCGLFHYLHTFQTCGPSHSRLD